MHHPFHLAFPVRDLEETRLFYEEVLRCPTGRSGDDWLDIDFFGSQIVAHVLASEFPALPHAGTNRIDDHEIPVPHFGAVLPIDEWHTFSDRLQKLKIHFLVEPHTRYLGELNEQSSMIFNDPSGNTIELKAFTDPGRLFAT